MISSSRARAPHTILVVEDEGLVALDLQHRLTELGYRAPAVAASGREALELAEQLKPDLVLMDIRLQGPQDGISTAALLRDRYGLPVVYLTAYADEQTLARALPTGPYAYVHKPLRPLELHTAIQVALSRHEADATLRARERWFATTLTSIGDAVVSTDTAGRVTFLNRAAEQLTGVESAAALGLPLDQVMPLVTDTGRGPLKIPLAACLAGSGPAELPPGALLLSRDGTERLIDANLAPIADGARVLGAVVAFRDRSERRRLERQLEAANRLATLGTLAAGVAHEINNPLTYVMGNLEYIEAALALPKADAGELQRALADARAGAQRIRAIVADLKVLSRRPERVPGSCDVHLVLEWALQVVGDKLHDRARLVRSFGAVGPVVGDEHRLGQVFVNLLANAAEAIQPGAAVTNEVRLVTSQDAAGRVVVEVSDTGSGMTPEVADHVFEPFFTTKPVGAGTGLGLSICAGVLGAIGGEISVESQPGRGTTFRVVLPLAGPMAAAAPPVAELAAAVARARILVVDDEDLVRRAIARILQPYHDVVACASGEEALARLEEGQRFDVVLCDLLMPELSGMTLHRRLVASHPSVAERMVFMTGGAVTVASAAFLARVPNPRLLKPFDTDRLLAAVAGVLAHVRT